jgi:hypothetical protein
MVWVTVCQGGHNKFGHYAGKLRYFLVPEAEYDKRGEFGFVIEDETKYKEMTSDFEFTTVSAQQ